MDSLPRFLLMSILGSSDLQQSLRDSHVIHDMSELLKQWGKSNLNREQIMLLCQCIQHLVEDISHFKQTMIRSGALGHLMDIIHVELSDRPIDCELVMRASEAAVASLQGYLVQDQSLNLNVAGAELYGR